MHNTCVNEFCAGNPTLRVLFVFVLKKKLLSNEVQLNSNGIERNRLFKVFKTHIHFPLIDAYENCDNRATNRPKEKPTAAPTTTTTAIIIDILPRWSIEIVGRLNSIDWLAGWSADWPLLFGSLIYSLDSIKYEQVCGMSSNACNSVYVCISLLFFSSCKTLKYIVFLSFFVKSLFCF